MAEVLREAAETGDTALPLADARQRLGELLAASPETVDAAIERERQAGRLVQHELAGQALIMLAELDRAERVDRQPAGGPGRGRRRPGSRPMPQAALARSEAALRRGAGPDPARRHRARDPQPRRW